MKIDPPASFKYKCPQCNKFWDEQPWKARFTMTSKYCQECIDSWGKDKQTINIKDLKMGDRVKYKLPFFSPYMLDYPKEGEGIIQSLDGEYVELSSGHKFYKKYIISKLESNPKIKINDLKLGDRIKYRKHPQNPHLESCITKEGILHCLDYYHQLYWVGEDVIEPEDIISKLEPLSAELDNPLDLSNKKIGDTVEVKIKNIKYKEIFINHNTSISCKQCIKNEIVGANLKGLENYICPECQLKNKSAPESYKYDIFITEFSQECGGPYNPNPKTTVCGCGVGIDGKSIEFKNLPFFNSLGYGQIYTIEIKKKNLI